MKDTFKYCYQSKSSRYSFYPFLLEFQVLLQVIGDSGQVHHFVRLCEAYRIDLPQAHELGQGAEDGFHRTLALPFHVPALRTLHPCDVPFVFFPVVGYRELLLLCAFPQTAVPDRAIDADMLSRAVLLLSCAGTVIPELFGERDHHALWTAIMVVFFNIRETVRTALVGAMGRNETFKVLGLEHCVVLPAAIARIGNAILPNKTLLP